MTDRQEADALLDRLVDGLKARGDLADARLEAAFRAVPRHFFLPGVPLETAYSDDAVPVKHDADGTVLSSSSQPAMIAAMLAQLRLRPGDNVLEIGTGTGYNAALMQHIVGAKGKVTSIEIDSDVVRKARENLQRLALGSKINIVHADGAMGYAPRAAYDRIVATTSIWDVPPAWSRQMKQEGLLVAPVWLDALQVSGAFRLQPDGTLYSDNNMPCGFVAMRGPAAGPPVSTRIGRTALRLISNHADSIDETALQMLLSEDAEDDYFPLRLTASDYWSSFLPYVMLNLPDGYYFALYDLTNQTPAFGIEQQGFSMLAQGSACFIPYGGAGKVHCFAGSDTFVMLQEALSAWDRAGRPSANRLRLRLTPITDGKPATNTGRVYERPNHTIHVWMEGKDGAS